MIILLITKWDEIINFMICRYVKNILINTNKKKIKKKFFDEETLWSNREPRGSWKYFVNVMLIQPSTLSQKMFCKALLS